MYKRWSLLIAVVTIKLVSSVALEGKENKHSPDRKWYHPRHHWHDCGSSEQDWDNFNPQPWKDPDNGKWGDHDGKWIFPDHRPRPPWPQPTPRPTPTHAPPTRHPLPHTTKSPEDLKACLKSCPITDEYNPVCGTNGVTYTNLAHLICAQFCGIDVELASKSQCSSDGSTNQPPTSPRPLPDVQACIKRCPVTPEYNPVCGSDGVTYGNPGRLACAKMCGVNVHLVRNSRCPNGGSTGETTTTPRPNPDIQACISRCPVTPEYNPVCGSDGVTYGNPGRLECAKMCGVNVQLARNSKCPPNPQPSTTQPPIIDPHKDPSSQTTISQDVLDLIFTTTTENDGTGVIDERHQDD